jgi:hypothetical protein
MVQSGFPGSPHQRFLQAVNGSRVWHDMLSHEVRHPGTALECRAAFRAMLPSIRID